MNQENKSSAWADYFNEYFGLSVIENEKFLLAYEINNHDRALMVEHFYLKPQFRLPKASNEALNIILKKAQENSCDFVIATVDHSNKMKSLTIRAHLKFGFNIVATDSSRIWLRYLVS